MTYKLELIEHTNTAKLSNYMRLFHYLSVYEENGSLQQTIEAELLNFDRKGKFQHQFNLVLARNDAGSIVGYVFYYPRAKRVEFYVLPTWRNKGVGNELVLGVRTWSKYSTLCGYPGFGCWKEFFEKNFILNIDKYMSISRVDVAKYGGAVEAYKAVMKAEKLRLSRELRKVLDFI
jgi:GNAT superfamily N-acetyltransferase